MRHIVQTFIAALFVTNLHAAPVEYFNTVLNHRHVRDQCIEGSNLVSISHTMTFRCPGCFIFELVFDSQSGQYKHKAQTSLDFDTKKINVKFLVPPPNNGPTPPSAR